MSGATDTASCAVALPEGGVPEWVHLLPSGEIVGRDGRRWRLSDPSGLVSAFAAGGKDLPIDYEHQTEFAPKNGQPAPAAGWIKELAVRPDGIWGRVAWTDRGAAMVRNREYRYLSPVFKYSKISGEVVALNSAGLTNMPNLFLTALARQGADDMSLLIKLAAALELPETSSEDELLAKVAELSSLGKASNRVASADMLEVIKELNHLRGERHDAMVADAMKRGLLPPALSEWAHALCRENPESFKDFCDKAVPLGLTVPTNRSWANPPGGRQGASDEETAVCRSLGITAEELRKNMEAAR